jgi:predicted metal-dependent phosphoesterase TrpH
MINDKKPMDRIDLHTHSSHSDGSFAPRQLVQFAQETGLRAIALTDHDTVAGLAEALAAGADLGVEVVPGLEISAQYARGTMHILGYYVSHGDPELVGALNQLQQARRARNPRMIERLRALGLAITLAEVLDLAGGQVGRPHIARVLVRRGYVSSINEAFNRYLTKGAPAYVEKFRFSPQQAINLIRRAGGLAVLAHPFTLAVEEPGELSHLVGELQELGLEGIEVFYPEHSQEMVGLYGQLAQRFGLLCTGGSDFHGNLRDDSNLGGGRNAEKLDYKLLEEMQGRLRQREKWKKMSIGAPA